ncbi:MAG: glycerophosphodiester phosphodiesterase family protein [Candidatus Neomarinimicrobiota bacterium]
MTAFIIIVPLVLLNIRFSTFWQAMDLTELYRNKPVYFGHRGDRKAFPENTIASYRSAIKKGLVAIEIDVMLTKDNRLVCSHNFDLEHETNGKGFIDEINYQDLVKVKTGKRFPAAKQAAIPLLTDVVKAIPKTALINIEIKTKGTFDLKAARKVAHLIKNGEIPQKVIVSSFNPLAVRIVKLISRSTPTGFIFKETKHFKGVYIARPDCLQPKAELITDTIINFCRKRNMRINAWTVNEIETRNWLIQKDIDGIITDDPKLAKSSTNV